MELIGGIVITFNFFLVLGIVGGVWSITQYQC